jgi:hypothetical protein
MLLDQVCQAKEEMLHYRLSRGYLWGPIHRVGMKLKAEEGVMVHRAAMGG